LVVKWEFPEYRLSEFGVVFGGILVSVSLANVMIFIRMFGSFVLHWWVELTFFLGELYPNCLGSAK